MACELPLNLAIGPNILCWCVKIHSSDVHVYYNKSIFAYLNGFDSLNTKCLLIEVIGACALRLPMSFP